MMRSRRRAEDFRQLLRFLGRSAVVGQRIRRAQVPVSSAPPSVTRAWFDPVDAATIAHPYPAYQRLREGSRVQVIEKHDVWLVHRHEDVRRVLREHETFSSAAGVVLSPQAGAGLLGTDPPEHDRLRSSVSALFTKAALRAMTDSVYRRSTEGVNALGRGGVVDAVPALCVPLPVGVICDMLGVPESRMPQVREWSNRLVGLFSDSTALEALRGATKLLPPMFHIRNLVSDELVRPDRGDDLIARMAHAVAAGQLTHEEALLMAFIVLVAGHETTVNVLGAALHVLSEDPELYGRLREEPTAIPAFVEETMRLHSPVQWVARQTTRPAEFDGVVVPARSRVVALIGAANRDPDHYPSPEVLDVGRRVGDHLGFGAGVHFCLGAHLTRLEAKVVLEILLETVPSLAPAGPVRWARTASLRGPVSLPLRLGNTVAAFS